MAETSKAESFFITLTLIDHASILSISRALVPGFGGIKREERDLSVPT